MGCNGCPAAPDGIVTSTLLADTAPSSTLRVNGDEARLAQRTRQGVSITPDRFRRNGLGGLMGKRIQPVDRLNGRVRIPYDGLRGQA